MTECPYVGLQAYTEAEADYFFGRERDQRIVVANLSAARLSVLYGVSGAGKSSLLLAGVVPKLRERAAVAVVRAWQGRDVLEAVKQECVAAAHAAGGNGRDLDSGLPLDELLARVGEVVGGPVYLLLDQFEEYFVAHARTSADEPFEAELARVVNTHELDAAVLVSLREDAIAGLDRFRRRIPGLLSAAIRLEHLTAEAAEQAIRGPLAVYGDRTGTAVSVEDELVRELLDEVRVRPGSVLAQAGSSGAEGGIETPFLQLVLERLWHAEREAGSTMLRAETFRALGGASGIVARHFDSVVDSLTSDERELCSRFFDRLVTASGGKIVYPVDDLNVVAGPLAPQVAPTLRKLTEARILHRVELPDRPAVEIFHDVLAPTILRWQEQFVRLRERQLERRRLLRRLLQAAAVVVALLAFFGYRSYTNWLRDRPWATLTNLVTGKPFDLAGRQVSAGRNVPGYYENEVAATPQPVSRLHLTVFKRGRRAIDMRSLYGTTINARFLEYGESRSLRPGDVVVLAGLVPFEYRPVGYSWYQVWTPSAKHERPARGWGLLVDGSSRTASQLVRPLYFLAARGRGIVALAKRSADSLAAVRVGNDGLPQIEDLRDDTPLQAKWKTADSEQYPTGTASPAGFFSTFREDFQPMVFTLGGRPFQLVPLRPQLG